MDIVATTKKHLLPTQFLTKKILGEIFRLILLQKILGSQDLGNILSWKSRDWNSWSQWGLLSTLIIKYGDWTSPLPTLSRFYKKKRLRLDIFFLENTTKIPYNVMKCLTANDNKHRKNCECCPVSLLIVRQQRLLWIHVLNCQNCNYCLKCHKSLGLSLSLSL